MIIVNSVKLYARMLYVAFQFDGCTNWLCFLTEVQGAMMQMSGNPSYPTHLCVNPYLEAAVAMPSAYTTLCQEWGRGAGEQVTSRARRGVSHSWWGVGEKTEQ